MYTEKLKPCPFCGGPAKFRTEPDLDECGCCTGYGWLQVVCEECGARTNEFFCERHEHPNAAEKLEAKEAWNRRCDAPTIDHEELRPKGKWIEQTVRGNLVMVCSVCHCDSGLYYEQKYCPNCGEKMEEGNNEAD